eukprot:gene2780-biopygen9973
MTGVAELCGPWCGRIARREGRTGRGPRRRRIRSDTEKRDYGEAGSRGETVREQKDHGTGGSEKRWNAVHMERKRALVDTGTWMWSWGHGIRQILLDSEKIAYWGRYEGVQARETAYAARSVHNPANVHTIPQTCTRSLKTCTHSLKVEEPRRRGVSERGVQPSERPVAELRRLVRRPVRRRTAQLLGVRRPVLQEVEIGSAIIIVVVDRGVDVCRALLADDQVELRLLVVRCLPEDPRAVPRACEDPEHALIPLPGVLPGGMHASAVLDVVKHAPRPRHAFQRSLVGVAVRPEGAVLVIGQNHASEYRKSPGLATPPGICIDHPENAL